MKVDFSDVPDTDFLDELVKTLKQKENVKVKKEGKTLNISDLSSRKIKFYTKKALNRARDKFPPGEFKVISQGAEGFHVYFKEYIL